MKTVKCENYIYISDKIFTFSTCIYLHACISIKDSVSEGN